MAAMEFSCGNSKMRVGIMHMLATNLAQRCALGRMQWPENVTARCATHAHLQAIQQGYEWSRCLVGLWFRTNLCAMCACKVLVGLFDRNY